MKKTIYFSVIVFFIGMNCYAHHNSSFPDVIFTPKELAIEENYNSNNSYNLSLSIYPQQSPILNVLELNSTCFIGINKSQSDYYLNYKLYDLDYCYREPNSLLTTAYKFTLLNHVHSEFINSRTDYFDIQYGLGIGNFNIDSSNSYNMDIKLGAGYSDYIYLKSNSLTINSTFNLFFNTKYFTVMALNEFRYDLTNKIIINPQIELSTSFAKLLTSKSETNKSDLKLKAKYEYFESNFQNHTNCEQYLSFGLIYLF